MVASDRAEETILRQFSVNLTLGLVCGLFFTDKCLPGKNLDRVTGTGIFISINERRSEEEGRGGD
jgi:hypothetical protein